MSIEIDLVVEFEKREATDWGLWLLLALIYLQVIENDIMKEYLERYGSEVRIMISLEWDDEIYREVLLEEGREEGLEKGREEGMTKGMVEVAKRLKDEGMETALITKVTGLSEEDVSAL